MKTDKGGNFDSVAPIYDTLSRVMFGNTLMEAQVYFLNNIPPDSKVLILGGGSGELLQSLLRVQPSCHVYYVDASVKMIQQSRRRVDDSDNVTFLHGTESDIPAGVCADVIITNFYLDLFDESSLQGVIKKVKVHAKQESLWLVTDFVNTDRLTDKVLLKLMYIFFRVTSGIEAKRLPGWEEEMNKNFTAIASKYFRRGFVRSVVFQIDEKKYPR